MTTNWAGNITYAAARVVRATAIDQVQEVVAGAARVRALGSGHSFTTLADTTGTLVNLADIPPDPVLDESAATVTVGAGTTYGWLSQWLDDRGWALANLASLPHISVAGAVATGTHGSGVRNPTLSAAVAALELVGADGSLRRVARHDADFDGHVVALGALGLVTRITLDVERAYQVRQDLLLGLPFDALTSGFDELAGSAYSVSFVTSWTGDRVEQVWVKSRDLDVQPRMPGTTAAGVPTHMLTGGDLGALTEQGGVAGPWLDRLPHFRLGFTPSRGAELQSEWFVPRRQAAEAIEALRPLGPHLAQVLQNTEIRTVAADRLWLSPAFGDDQVAFHFTWQLDQASVDAELPGIESALSPMGARPHWGKCFIAGPDVLAPLYPRWSDFAALRDRVDPQGKFGNAFLDRVLGTAAPSVSR